MDEKYEMNLVDSDQSRIKNPKEEENRLINCNEISEILLTIINNNLSKAIEKVNKILLIGENSNHIYNQLNNNFSNVRFLIANTSESILKSLNNKKKSKKNYSVHTVDVFDGRSLFNFTLKFNKFDLIIISNLYKNFENKEKIRNSVRFIYKHLLKNKGMFCILTSIRYLESSKFTFLRNVKPLLSNKLEIKHLESPLNLTLYIKK